MVPGLRTDIGRLTPRPFALHAIGDADATPHGPLVAWGMTLPDGSAVTVDWRDGPPSDVTLSTNPERAARLHDAELVWLRPLTRTAA
ncbi:hypothetical protein GCM10009557_00170 [Virgisporangium ochraceum]|uniref:Uncharacterized protein n=1 Tax=Virgisporangium ochraceum TaxID=65505 RepID=A0A8J4EGM9_9ACTN|nr:hypothetical protein Voc01_089660 [Virgisporangium ochraceum]